jgi:hypothetical protein
VIPRQAAIATPASRDLLPSEGSFGPSDLAGPLENLLQQGGDLRLQRDPATGLNRYGCGMVPDTKGVELSSSTATPISGRAFAAAGAARASLVDAMTNSRVEEAFETRIEALRDGLKDCLGLSETDVVFSPSGTDSQLQAVFVAQVLLGPHLTIIVVGADQTGSGTIHTARAQHFSEQSASGRRVSKGGRIDGFAAAIDSVSVPLVDADGAIRRLSDIDTDVQMAVAAALAAGRSVLVMVMDSSKLGWCAPSDDCIDAIAKLWPGRIQIVVDACQMRLGRARLQAYLRRGCMVLMTGSKYFTGPAFSGALLLPAAMAETIDAIGEVPSGLRDYGSRSDWPRRLGRLRAQLSRRTNLGQWLRWEAALEEIRCYQRIPPWFRREALRRFASAAHRHIGSSPVLRVMPRLGQLRRSEAEEEFATPTIVPFSIHANGRALDFGQLTALYHALNWDLRSTLPPQSGDDLMAIAGTRCLVGQPVALPGHGGQASAAILRISADARYVTDAWTEDTTTALANLDRSLKGIATMVAKLEMLIARPAMLQAKGIAHAV